MKCCWETKLYIIVIINSHTAVKYSFSFIFIYHSYSPGRMHYNHETRDLFSLNPWPEQQRLNIQLHNFMFTSSSFSGFAPVPADTVKNTEGGLTILTSIYLQSESNPPSGVPVKRNQAEVAGYHGLFQFVLDHRVCITVSWKSLKQHDNIQYFRYPNSNIQPSMFYYSSQHLME